jgi:hypothetical protein
MVSAVVHQSRFIGMQMTRSALLLFFFIAVAGSNKLFSQNCEFSVQAGPDVDVCETGSAVLDGYMGGGASRITWQGGKGKFLPDRHTLNAEYVPDASEVGTTVLLMLAADNPEMKSCKAAIDTELIRINYQPIPHAGENQRICSGEKVLLQGHVDGRAKEAIWKTTGSGTFDDAHLLNATYIPSAADINKRGCSLYLLTLPYGFCSPDSDAISIAIEPAPFYSVMQDVKATAGQPVSLSITMNGKRGKMEWNTQGSGRFTNIDQESTEYIFSAADIENSSVVVSVTVQSAEGTCPVTKNITLHTGELKTN